jgi:hypothetical protein
MRYWLLSLLLVSIASAQLPVVPMISLLSSGVTDPTTCNCLAEWWQFDNAGNGLTTNDTVTNWIGAYAGYILTNGSSGLRPTNSASGVGVGAANLRLTNIVNINLSTNWTIMHVFKMAAHNTGAAGMAPILGQDNTAFAIGSANAANRADYVAGLTVAQPLDNNANSSIGFNIYYDQITVRSNDSNGGLGQMYGHTNGVFAAAATVASMGLTQGGAQRFGAVGANPTWDTFAFISGFYTDVLIWTNRLTASQITSAHNALKNKRGY